MLSIMQRSELAGQVHSRNLYAPWYQARQIH